MIGAGNFAFRTLIPALRGAGAHLRTIASGTGTSAAIAARRFGFERATTDVEGVLADEAVDTVFLLTRHDSHARLALRALRAGKHVFVEKPLALSEAELDAVAEAARESRGLLMVGFNRRFAPLTERLREHLRGRGGPLSLVFTINAGAVPREHWLQDPAVGGGRIVGEACHWMDLARLLVGRPIRELQVVVARDAAGRPLDDIAHLSLAFEDGSTAAIHYLSSGARSFPKERIDCFFDGKTLSIDNWRRLHHYGVPGPLLKLPGRMDKGHGAEIREWLRAVRAGGPAPIPLEELVEVSRWAIRAAEMARRGSE